MDRRQRKQLPLSGLQRNGCAMEITMPTDQPTDAGKSAGIEVMLRERIAALEQRATDITQAQANELQDVLRTLTNSGTALLTSARELVKLKERAESRVAALEQELNRANSQVAVAGHQVEEAVQETRLERGRRLQASARADQLAADVLSLSYPVCQQLLKDKRLAEVEVEHAHRDRDSANAERLDAVRVRELFSAKLDESMRDGVKLHTELGQARAALRMVADTMADIYRCEESVLCSECQAIKDAMVANIDAALQQEPGATT